MSDHPHIRAATSRCPWLRLSALGLIGALLAGCGSPPPALDMDTAARPLLDPITKIVVISQVARVDTDWAAPFAEAITGEFERRGVQSATVSPDPLALDPPLDAYTNALATLTPEAILLVLPREGTVDRSGRQVMRRFETGLFAYTAGEGRGRLLWRAGITLSPAGPYIGPRDLRTLARDIVRQLDRDHLVAPAATPRPTAQPASRTKRPSPPYDPRQPPVP